MIRPKEISTRDTKETTNTRTSQERPRGFDVTAHWVSLTEEENVVPESADNPDFFYAPTIP